MQTVHTMRPIATDIARSLVCLRLCVSHTNLPSKKDRSDRVAVCWLTRIGPRKNILHWGQDSSPRKGAILWVERPTEKHCESLLRCT